MHILFFNAFLLIRNNTRSRLAMLYVHESAMIQNEKNTSDTLDKHYTNTFKMITILLILTGNCINNSIFQH